MAELDLQSIEEARQALSGVRIVDTFSDDNISTCSAESSLKNVATCAENWSKSATLRYSARRQKWRASGSKLEAKCLPDEKLTKSDSFEDDTSAASCADQQKPLKQLVCRKNNKRRSDHLSDESASLGIFMEFSTSNYDALRKSKRKGKNRARSMLVQYLSNSASNGSLTSLNSSTSSGIDTADSSNKECIRDSSTNRLFLKGRARNHNISSTEHGNTSPSIPDSSTSSSIGFGDEEFGDENLLHSVESATNGAVVDDERSVVEAVRLPQAKNNDGDADIDEHVLLPTTYTPLESPHNINNDLIHVPITYYPIQLLNNFNAIHQRNYEEISPLLNNPNVEKFYNEQREYYRKIYDQQFASGATTMMLNEKNGADERQNGAGVFKPINDRDVQLAQTSTSTNFKHKYNHATYAQSQPMWRQQHQQQHAYEARNYGKKFYPKANPHRHHYAKSFYQPHKHLGYPVTLPYAALMSWKTLGLDYPYYVMYWQYFDKKLKQQMLLPTHHYTMNNTFVYQTIYNAPAPTPQHSADEPTPQADGVKQEFEVEVAQQNENSSDDSKYEANMLSTSSDPVTMADFCAPKCRVNGVGNGHYEFPVVDVLSDQIMEFHQSVEQQLITLNRKLNLRDMLYHTIAPIFPMCGLYIVGSSLNGFGNSKSDMDLCLMITNRDIDQRSDAVIVLQSIMRTLQTTKFVANQQLILAKVPILRINFHSTFSDITVDLNANNSVAIRNTHLLCYYSSFDWRVRPLVAVVKEWAKRRGINDANRSSFTSYSLVLMVIHYLQCGAEPPVLPSLQRLYPRRFNQRADVRQLNVSHPLDPAPSTLWNFNDRLTLGELLIGFFQYYAFSFNFDADAISIRLGCKTDRALVARNRSPYNHLSQWHCICIEEPFTFSNTAHSVYDERIFNSIKKSFIDGFHQLDANRNLNSFLADGDVQET